MIMTIVTEGDPVLRQVAKPVSKVTKSLEKLAADMLETMYQADGVGLAAPQVGISKRVIVVDTGDGAVMIFNPEIIGKVGCIADTEGCLSVPGVVGKVERCEGVVVRGMTSGGRVEEYEATGYFARALQHEIDHLDGVLFIDKATEIGREEA